MDAEVTGDGIALTFRNLGQAGAVFHAYDKLHLDRIPRRYTVEAGKVFNDHWARADDGSYDLWILGPNGFLREFQGTRGEAGVEVCVRDVPLARAIELRFNNAGTERRKISLISNIYEPRQVSRLSLRPGQTSLNWDVAKSGNWYELLVSVPGCARRFAGRVETGRNSISDPAMGIG